MTNIYLLMNLVIVSAIIVICAIPRCDGVISDKRLCYDPKCSEPVSLARTMVPYNSIEPHILSFPSNTEVTIFSKEAGSRLDLWGAAIRGKRGYVPKTLVRETRKLKSNLTYEVPTEFGEQVKSTDKPKVDVPSDLEAPKFPKSVVAEVNNTVDESQKPNNLKDAEEIEVKGTKNESGNSKKPETVKPETEAVDPTPAVDPSDSQVKESTQNEAEPVLDGVQSVTPSFEVIDGTAIPLLPDEVQIEPSYATPIVAATATRDEGPILSVHPTIPSNDRPLLSRFSKSDSHIVENQSKAESDVLAENDTGEDESEKQSLPVQDKVDEVDMGEENNGGNDVNIDISGDNSLDEDTQSAEISEPAKDSTENSQTIINNVESNENNQILSSDNSGDASDRTSTTEAAGSSADVTQKDGLDGIENIPVVAENENVISSPKPESETDEVLDVVKKEDESGKDVPTTDLNNNSVQEELADSDNDSPKVVNSSSEIEGTILEEELQDSKEQTEYLSDENITDTRKGEDEADKSDKKTVEETAQENDDQVIVNNEVLDHNENFTVHNADDGGIEMKIKDGSQNNSQKEIVGNDYSLDNFPSPGNEEITTEDLYLNLGEEKLTTARSLFSVDDDLQKDDNQSSIEALDFNEPVSSETQTSQENENYTYNEADVAIETPELDTAEQSTESTSFTENSDIHVAPQEVCDINSDCADLDKDTTSPNEEQDAQEEDEGSFPSVFGQHNYLETLLYLCLTAFTTLLFSLGYYYIENQRRDMELVAKINVLEKELLVTTKESMMLDEGLKATKHKLNSIEDESFGSNEMVVSLKAEIEAGQIAKGELEDQIITLEKELESATEAGLELERMLREFLASQSDENPLAQSVEDLQTRLNAQQATNESLTNSLNLKSQENEALTTELACTQERCQQLDVEVTRLSEELKTEINLKNSAEKENLAKIVQLNKKVKKLAEERTSLITQLTSKEMALNDLSEVLKQQTDNFDFDKLYDVSHIKAEAQLVTTERDELKMKLTEVEGAHQLLEEHMKLIKEEIASVTEQYELAERDKTEAQTRLEVLSNYFKEKETQLQKELGMQEAMWVQKQGEVTSTVDRIQTMQNEIQNYRQQIETLKREILDQEREYKSQIAALETKSHEQWVIARQSERRLEESKAEASQLRNRLTMVEKSINEVDPDSKLHRLETNGETASSPQLFMGAESSSSPIIFSGSSGVPPLPPSYMYGAPLPPPFIPPPPHSGGGPMYDISRRPPPLGGRLSSPPPIPLHHPSGRYEDASSPPPPLSPPLHPPYNHRSPPPFSNERIHPHPPPPFLPPLGTSHSWGDEPLPPMRNPVFHPHQQREQRVRNHKGSLHSSGDSLDKTNHTGKS